MKKIISFLLVLLLLLSCLLVSCSEGIDGDSSNDASNVTDESKPWYSTSAPDDYSNIIIDPSSDADSDGSQTDGSSPATSVPDTSVPDTSVPDTSVPEISLPETSENEILFGYDSLPKIDGYVFNKSAIGHQTVYTKVSALNATECITNCNVGITAIYDGSVTRFFDAVNGTYYHAVSGKYLYPCCEGSFLAGDLNDFNSNYSITFTRVGETEVTFVMNDHAGHGIDFSYNSLYCKSNKKVYAYDQELYRVHGAMPCRLYVGDSESLGSIDANVDESKLLKYGVASNEKVIIPFEYDLIITANENVGVYLAVKDGRCYYFSSEGRNLTPDGFDCGSQPFNDRAWVFNGSQGYIIKFN